MHPIARAFVTRLRNGRADVEIALVRRILFKTQTEVTTMAFKINDTCISCGTCAANCPVSAITEGDTQYNIDADTCISCGNCAANCPVGAISED